MNRYHYLAISLTAFAFLVSNMGERSTVEATGRPTTETRIRCNIPNVILGRPLHEAYAAMQSAEDGDVLDFTGEVYYTLPGQKNNIRTDHLARNVEVRGLKIVNYGCETFEDEALYIGNTPLLRSSHVVYDSTVMVPGLVSLSAAFNQSADTK